MLSRQLTQSSYRGDLEGLIDGNMKGRIDSEGSYCPLDNIAIHEDSDTEYFDAKGREGEGETERDRERETERDRETDREKQRWIRNMF